MSKYNDFLNSIIIQHGQHRKSLPNPDGTIYERHHIKPRCVGGTDDMYNLIDLTLREHYIAHMLLAEEYPNDEKIICAWHYMSTIRRGAYQVTPEEYEASRTAIIRAQGNAVYQINDNQEVIACYPSAREAARQLNTSPSHIIECCNKQRHQALGYYWQTVEDYTQNGFSHKPFQNGSKPRKAVNQYDMKGNFIATYKTATEAGRAVGRDHQAIRSCCLGKTKQSAGYIWKFVE